MKNKLIALLLAAALLLTVVSAVAESAENEFVVGSTTQMKGDFFTEMFGNNTADMDVRALLHGYNLVHWDESQGVYIIDPSVVKAVYVSKDAAGNRTYTLTLRNDLFYSDGTAINAWDYAFSLLLQMSPEMEKIGAKIYRAEHLLGSGDYLTGNAKALAGVRVTADDTLAITLDHSYLPYFYEVGLLLCEPYPIRVIAPGCKVYDDGEGVYIGNEDLNVSEPVFTAELLQGTVMDPETGYKSHPSVVSGPYVLTSFDGVTAHFEKNPWFKGALKIIPNEIKEPNGIPVLSGETTDDSTYLVKPHIEKLAFTLADNNTMMQDLKDGKLNLINKAMYAPALSEGLRETSLLYTRYPRVGLSYVSFACDRPAVSEKEVRQAIAWCMDRDSMTTAYCGRYGYRVDGYYGIEQWEYMLVSHKMDEAFNFEGERLPGGLTAHGTAKGADWASLNLNKLTVYRVNTEKANALLDAAGWTLGADGAAYAAGDGAVRCKEIDGTLVPLELTLLMPAGNHMADYLQEYFIDNLNACGIKLTVTEAGMADLLKQYYREEERTADMIYLATNFHVLYDPSITYSTDTSLNHASWNVVYSDDEELWNRAVDMRKTYPEDVFGYVRKWIAFQERFNEVLPMIPVYSNIYYDFYTKELVNYNITAHLTWSQAILDAVYTPQY